MEQLFSFVTHHWLLSLALVLILALIFLNDLIGKKTGPQELSTAAMIGYLNKGDAVVMDLRSPEIFKSGHVINAIQVNEADFSQDKMQKYKDKPLILICPNGLKAKTLAMNLRKKGFQQTMILSGGMAAWLKADLPVVKGK